MKFMGSKRAMLQNGLGTLISKTAPRYDRFVDLFCGSASVSWYAATRLDLPVFSADLQHFATTLAGSVVNRTSQVPVDQLVQRWLSSAKLKAMKKPYWCDALDIDQARWNTATWSKRARQFCDTISDTPDSLLCRAYGGHYFSPTQAILLDTLLNSVPTDYTRNICISAVIFSASQCAAAPGHTAQPFQPTRTASKYLREAWLRDPLAYAERALHNICSMHAKLVGKTLVGDAVDIASMCSKTDFVFVDPPYSAVHYSRFYHVLETIARGTCGAVSGTGRYPPPAERPASAFSQRGQAMVAISDLLKTLAAAGSCVAITFPEAQCSNGLSGTGIAELATKWFRIEHYGISARFSTLGGNNVNRTARQSSNELLLLLKPKRRVR